MNNNQLIFNANTVIDQLQMAPEEIKREDIVRFVRKNNIRRVNFLYPGGDGKVKTLNFVLSDIDYLQTILTCGERVDGSSLFSFIEAASSDLYVLPRFSTAFVDPFNEEPTLCMLCSFFNKNGQPLESSPEHTLRKAVETFRATTGMEFEAMGELEYYVIKEADENYKARDQHGYHESAPYAKMGEFRQKCMDYIAKAGGHIKYGHSEVGNFELEGLLYEQNEIEFLPVPAMQAADELLIAKWVIRNLAWRVGLNGHLRPEDYHGQGGLRAAHPHEAHEGRSQHAVDSREAQRQRAQGNSRMHRTRAKPHGVRQQDSDELFPPRATPRGTYEHLLGHEQPLRPRSRTIGLDVGRGHEPCCQPFGAGGALRGARKREADFRDSFRRRLGRRVPIHCRALRGVPPRFRDGQRP